MIKVGYIYFDYIHIIPHFIGSVAELYRDPDVEVDILVPDVDHSYLYDALEVFGVPKNVVKILPTYLYKRIAYKIQGRKRPSTSYIFKKHKKKLLDYDVLVFNVFNHGHLKRKTRQKPKFVFLMHGAGDSAYPFTDEFKPQMQAFDLVTTSGQKIMDLFAQNGPYPDTEFKICGYQKLDFVEKMRKRDKLFDNDKPTVLYNPHFKPFLTSFRKFGLDILEFFYKNKDYNLIFAPHMNLFNQSGKMGLDRNIVGRKYREAGNILIDFGSPRSVDMTYTYAADIYLGDVSSQVYEFWLQGPKPAIFLNAHNFDWRNDVHFQSWHLGKVMDNIDNLKEIIDTRDQWQKAFAEKQKQAIAYTFDIDPHKSSSQRVAEAIKEIALG